MTKISLLDGNNKAINTVDLRNFPFQYLHTENDTVTTDSYVANLLSGAQVTVCVAELLEKSGKKFSVYFAISKKYPVKSCMFFDF